MWRIYRRINCQVSGNIQLLKNSGKQKRQQSTVAVKRGKGKLVLALTGTSIAAAGGITLYAKYDPKFRAWLDSVLPFSVTKLLETIEQSTSRSIPVTLPKKTAPEISQSKNTLEKKIEEKQEVFPHQQTSKISDKSLSPLAAEVSPPSTSAASEQVFVSSFQPSLKRDDNLERKLTEHEIDDAAENAALEQILKENYEVLTNVKSEAIAAHKEVLKAMQFYSELVERSLDEKEVKEALGIQINSASMRKRETLKNADLKTSKAKEQIEKLRSAIVAGRESKLTAHNPALTAAEEALNDSTYHIRSAEALTSAAIADCEIMIEYCDMVEQARQEYQKEIAALMPEVKLGEKGKNLTHDELNNLISHAHRKIEQLQKQLAKQQISEKQRFQHALEKQQHEHSRMLDKRISLELEKQNKESELQLQKKLSDMNEEFEHELRIQLRRQAAAHSDHLQDVLKLQQTQFQTEFQEQLKEKLKKAQKEFEANLAVSFAKLQGIEKGMKARAQLNKSAKLSQELWLTSQSLKSAVTGNTSHHWKQQLRPLQPEIDKLLESSDESLPIISVVLGSIPEKAKKRGVYPESALKERFLQVQRVCRRVALIDEKGGSLIRFGLSYLQSFLIIDAYSNMSAEDLVTKPIDLAKLTPFDILLRAKGCIERNDLEQALRYMNLLQGAPRVVADDWLKEARLTLEVQQAASTLIALSVTLGVQAYL